jgi:pimeloyl-ACP methyl ester carboxylesterase
MRSAFCIFALPLLFFFVFGCSHADHGATAVASAADDDDNDNDDSDHYTPCDSTAMAVYQLGGAEPDLPYPSDYFTVADAATRTGRRLNLVGKTSRMLDYFFNAKPVSCLPNGLNTTDGFGVTSKMWLTLSEAPNLRSMTPGVVPSFDDGALLLRLGAAATDDVLLPFAATWTDDDKLLALAPSLPFEQTTRYAFVLTDRALTAESQCYAASPAFNRIRRGQPADAAEARAAEPLGDLFAHLKAHGVDPLAVSAAAVFTTQDLRSDLEEVRQRLDQSGPPALDHVEVQPAPAGWQGVSEMVVMKLHATGWRGKNGAFARGADGKLESFGDENLTAWLAMPLPANAIQPMPIVVFQHGFMADHTEMSGVVPWLCTAGFAVIGIDLPAHGERNPLPPALNGIGYMNFFNPLAWRDNGRQAAADHMALVRAIANLAKLDVWPPGGGDGQPDLDVTKIFYLGHSLGGMTGAMSTALDPTFQAEVLHAPPGDFHTLILHSPFGEIALDILQLIQENLHNPAYDRTVQFMDLYFPILESGVAMGYAPLLSPNPPSGQAPREALIQINAYDWAVPAPSSYFELAAGGIPLMKPLVSPIDGLNTVNAPHSGSAVGFQFPTADHGDLLGDPSNPIDGAMQGQIVTFFRSKLVTGTAQAVDPWN